MGQLQIVRLGQERAAAVVEARPYRKCLWHVRFRGHDCRRPGHAVRDGAAQPARGWQGLGAKEVYARECGKWGTC